MQGNQNPGQFYDCSNSGEVISIGFAPLSLSCTDDVGQCPGSAHFGCNGGDFGSKETTTEEPVTTTDASIPPPAPQPECEEGTNPFRECGCDGEMIVSDTCMEGYVCDSSLPSGGCLTTCPSGQRIVPDFETKEFTCADTTEYENCPGVTQLHCPSEDVGSSLDSSVCRCEGQLTVSSDCKDAFFCVSRIPEGGNHAHVHR